MESVPAEPSPVLSVVIPAYNEEQAIRGVVLAWDRECAGLGVPYEIRVYDDGSRDATGAIVETLAREHPCVVPVRQSNRGHGPTILRGYREARAEWVFQVDGDDEMGAESFRELWARRAAADLVLGYRDGRQASASRRLVTALSRATVRLLFGGSVRDVNTPYRLYRAAALARLLPAVPADTFAPNVLLTGLAIRSRMRIVQVPVDCRPRRGGAGSLLGWRLWRAAAVSFVQTVRGTRRRRADGSPPGQP